MALSCLTPHIYLVSHTSCLVLLTLGLQGRYGPEAPVRRLGGGGVRRRQRGRRRRQPRQGLLQVLRGPGRAHRRPLRRAAGAPGGGGQRRADEGGVLRHRAARRHLLRRVHVLVAQVSRQSLTIAPRRSIISYAMLFYATLSHVLVAQMRKEGREGVDMNPLTITHHHIIYPRTHLLNTYHAMLCCPLSWPLMM